jgi:integrase
MEGQQESPKLLDEVRKVLRLRHYSIHTERSYVDWIKRYVHFHHMRCRADLADGEKKIEAFLTDLAVRGRVAASTQNQAFNALLFVYREVLHVQIGKIESVRATRPARVPTVLTTEEARRVIGAMVGIPQLVVKLICGGGLRLLEALRLRVHDLDFERKQVTVRDCGFEI